MSYGCKKKTIAKVLHAKVKDWIKSVQDFELQQMLRKDVIVTGGSITSMLLGEEIKDFDIYFRTKETTVAVAKYYCEQFIKRTKNKYVVPVVKEDEFGRVMIYIASQGVAESDDAPQSDEQEYEDNLRDGGSCPVVLGQGVPNVEQPKPEDKYRPIFLSENAVTLTDKVQLVIRFYGEPSEIHKNYDYIHCQNVYDYAKDEVHLLPEALESILSKNLLYTGSLYPICSLFRMRKFLDRGWRISAGEIVKMSFQISKLNLSDIKVLKEQLTGCDMLYMKNLVDKLETWTAANPDTELDTNYVMQLINEVFN